MPASGAYTYAVSGDFNADGKPDLAMVSDFASPMVLLGKGDGTFSNLNGGFSTSVGRFNQMAMGDMNGDGKLT